MRPRIKVFSFRERLSFVYNRYLELLVKGKPHIKHIAGVSLAVPGYVYLGANPFKVDQWPQFFQGNFAFLLLCSPTRQPSLQSPGVEGQ